MLIKLVGPMNQHGGQGFPARMRGPLALDEILSLTSTWCPLVGAKEQVDQSDRFKFTELAFLPNFPITGYILLEMNTIQSQPSHLWDISYWR